MMPNEIHIFQPGEMLPDFSLPSTLGRPMRISDFRQRSNLVVIFCDPDRLETIRPFLADLNQSNKLLADENTQPLLVLPVPLEQAEDLKDQLDLTFPILADEQRKVTGQLFHVHQPGTEMYITDRFGEIYAVERVETSGHLPAAKEILDWVRYIEIQCPE